METSSSHGIGKEREQRPEMPSHFSSSFSLCSTSVGLSRGVGSAFLLSKGFWESVRGGLMQEWWCSTPKRLGGPLKILLLENNPFSLPAEWILIQQGLSVFGPFSPGLQAAGWERWLCCGSNTMGQSCVLMALPRSLLWVAGPELGQTSGCLCHCF